MSFDYSKSLACISAARSKRGRISNTKKFFDTLAKENRIIPSFDSDRSIAGENITDDLYSESLLKDYGPLDAGRGRKPKMATGNDNCLFNAASVALIGMLIVLMCETFYFSNSTFIAIIAAN